MLFLFFVPFIGICAYLIFRPHDKPLDEATIYMNTHARASGPSAAPTAEADIAHARALRDAGAITQAEYQDRVYRAEAGLPPTGAAPDFLSDKDSK